MSSRRTSFQRIPGEVVVPGIFSNIPIRDIISTLRTNKTMFNKYQSLYNDIFDTLGSFEGLDIKSSSMPEKFRQKYDEYEQSGKLYEDNKTYGYI